MRHRTLRTAIAALTALAIVGGVSACGDNYKPGTREAGHSSAPQAAPTKAPVELDDDDRPGCSSTTKVESLRLADYPTSLDCAHQVAYDYTRNKMNDIIARYKQDGKIDGAEKSVRGLAYMIYAPSMLGIQAGEGFYYMGGTEEKVRSQLVNTFGGYTSVADEETGLNMSSGQMSLGGKLGGRGENYARGIFVLQQIRDEMMRYIATLDRSGTLIRVMSISVQYAMTLSDLKSPDSVRGEAEFAEEAVEKVRESKTDRALEEFAPDYGDAFDEMMKHAAAIGQDAQTYTSLINLHAIVTLNPLRGRVGADL